MENYLLDGLSYRLKFPWQHPRGCSSLIPEENIPQPLPSFSSAPSQPSLFNLYSHPLLWSLLPNKGTSCLRQPPSATKTGQHWFHYQRSNKPHTKKKTKHSLDDKITIGRLYDTCPQPYGCCLKVCCPSSCVSLLVPIVVLLMNLFN